MRSFIHGRTEHVKCIENMSVDSLSNMFDDKILSQTCYIYYYFYFGLVVICFQLIIYVSRPKLI